MINILDYIDSEKIVRLKNNIAKIGHLNTTNSNLEKLLETTGLLDTILLGNINKNLCINADIKSVIKEGSFGELEFGKEFYGGSITETENIIFNQPPIALSFAHHIQNKFSNNFLRLPTTLYTGQYIVDNGTENKVVSGAGFPLTLSWVNVTTYPPYLPKSAYGWWDILTNITGTINEINWINFEAEQDWSTYTNLRAWVATGSVATDINVGDFRFVIIDPISGTFYIDIPQILATDTNYFLMDLDITPVLLANVQGWGIQKKRDDFLEFFLDDLILYNPATLIYPVIISTLRGILIEDTDYLTSFINKGYLELMYTPKENEQFIVIYCPKKNMIRINNEYICYDELIQTGTNFIAKITGRGMLKSEIKSHTIKDNVELIYTPNHTIAAKYQTVGISSSDVYLDTITQKVGIKRPSPAYCDYWQRDIIEYTTIKGKNTFEQVEESLLRIYPFLRGRSTITTSPRYPGAILIWFEKSKEYEKLIYDVWEYYANNQIALPGDILLNSYWWDIAVPPLPTSYFWDNPIILSSQNYNSWIWSGVSYGGLGLLLTSLPPVDGHYDYMIFPEEVKWILPANTGILFLDQEEIL